MRRLDEIVPEFEGTVRLSDIPYGAELTPEEVEALANREFDFAMKEKVDLRTAREEIRKQNQDEMHRRNLMDLRKAGFEIGEIPFKNVSPGTIAPAPGLSARETGVEVGKALQRGPKSVAKLPGVFLKAAGENAARPNVLTQGAGAPLLPDVVKESLRKAGDKWIATINNFGDTEPSDEMKWALQRDFRYHPLSRTLTAVGESGPTYGAAIAATIITKNPNIGLTLLATTSGAQEYEQLRSEKVDPDLALVGATIVGSLEYATEKVPMNILLRGGARPLLVRFLQTGTAESFQELLAQLGQNYVSAVTKNVDPENLLSITEAAQREWSIITQGWQDAMAAGFLMGGGAAFFSGDSGRTASELEQEFGPIPKTDQEFIDRLTQIRGKVRAVEAAREQAEEKTADTGTEAQAPQDEPQGATQPQKVEVSIKSQESQIRSEIEQLRSKKVENPSSVKEGMRNAILDEMEMLAGEQLVEESNLPIISRAQTAFAKNLTANGISLENNNGLARSIWDAAMAGDVDALRTSLRKQAGYLEGSEKEITLEYIDLVADLIEAKQTAKQRPVSSPSSSEAQEIPPAPLYYHGSPTAGLTEIQPSPGDYGNGIYLTTDQDTAREYSKGRKNTAKFVLGETDTPPQEGTVYGVTPPETKNPLIINTPEDFQKYEEMAIQAGHEKGDTDAIGEWARENGYDAVIDNVTKQAVFFTDKPATVIPPAPSGKQPWEMTRAQFENEFRYHGRKPDHEYYGKPTVKGGVAKDVRVAKEYAGIPYGIEGEIRLIRSKDLPDKLAQKDIVDNIPDAIESKYSFPATELNPHKYFVQQALSEGKPVPVEVLAEYPDLDNGDKTGTIETMTEEQASRDIAPQTNAGGKGEARHQSVFKSLIADRGTPFEKGIIVDTETGQILSEISHGSDGKSLNTTKATNEYTVDFKKARMELSPESYGQRGEYHYHPVAGGPTLEDIETFVARGVDKSYGTKAYGVIDDQYLYELLFDSNIEYESSMEIISDLKKTYEDTDGYFSKKIDAALNYISQKYGIQYSKVPISSFNPPAGQQRPGTPPRGSKSILDKLTPEERAELERLEKELVDKTKTQLGIGLDPDTFVLATRIGSFYVKAGYRAFKEWASVVRQRIGEISDYTLRTVYANLRNEYTDLDTDEQIDDALRARSVGEELGTGESKTRGLAESIEAQAVQRELTKTFGELPGYNVLNMQEQADKALKFIQEDFERAKAVAMGEEPAPPGLYPENVNTALRIHAVMNQDVQTLMDLALSPESNRIATILGQRIKSLDTGETYADPVRAIQEVIEARREAMEKKGQKTDDLEAEIVKLKNELARTKKALDEYMNQAEARARREYGSRNKYITRTAYEEIIARRKAEAPARIGKRGGFVYVPTAQDFSDMAKIGLFHLEAIGRDFALWSYNMTRDFGEWISPYLKEEYDKLLDEAKKQNFEIPESKRVKAKKSRMQSQAEKLETQFEAGQFQKRPSLPIELDEEGQELQRRYDLAREKYKTAQKVASVITEEEVRTIARLAKEAQDKKRIMEESPRRTRPGQTVQTEIEWGIAQFLFNEYVQKLKQEAGKRTIPQIILDYLKNPISFVSDVFGTIKTIWASLDDSFVGRQGRKVFYQGLTGNREAAKTWITTLGRSFKMIYDTFKGKQVQMALYAEIVSDPDYELIKKAKVATTTIEEELPVDIPSKIPLIGILFRASENAFVGSAHYMRYRIAKMYLDIYRNAGRVLDKKNLEDIGKLTNSMTGRGKLPTGEQPGFFTNVFWSPRNIKADLDFLFLHFLDPNMSAFAKKQAAINLLRYIAGCAAILALWDMFDDEAVDWDARSSDFGKIRVGNTRFSVGGGAEALIVLAVRLIKREYKSSTTGEVKSIDSGKYGALMGTDLVYNFLENKLAPGPQFVKEVLIDRMTREGEVPTLTNTLYDFTSPMQVKTYYETVDIEDRANIITIMLAEFMGVNTQTYEPKGKKQRKTGSDW
jgi:IS1 family transposase